MNRRGLATALAVCLLAAGCGGGHSDAGPSGPATTTGGAPTTTAGDGATTTTAVPEPGPGEFGDLGEVCGPGDAAGATDQGVSDTEINIGTMSDPGNIIVAGLNQELFDAATAFVEWCNAAGGILGRTINLTLRDAKLLEAQARITEACASDFMLVGGGVALDGPIAEVRVDCGLAQIPAYVNDPLAQGADLQAHALTAYPNYYGRTQHRLLFEAFPDSMAHYGLLTAVPTPAGSRPVADRERDAITPLGVDMVYNDATPPPPATVDNYGPYVEAMRSAGVRVVTYLTTPENTVKLQQGFAEAGYEPDFYMLQANHYNKVLIEGNDALGTTYVVIPYYPFEMADQNPATAQFLDILDAAVPGWKDDPKGLGVNGFSAWLLWALAAKACGSELTRACVIDEARTMDPWTGGGLHAPYNPDPTVPPTQLCGLILDATPDGFVYDEEITQPNSGLFNCSPDNFAEVAP